MPSYLGSKVQSPPAGMSVPIDASIGSSAPERERLGGRGTRGRRGRADFLRAALARGGFRLRCFRGFSGGGVFGLAIGMPHALRFVLPRSPPSCGRS